MVWSLVYSEDEFKTNCRVVDWHGIDTGSNSLSSMPIFDWLRIGIRLAEDWQKIG